MVIGAQSPATELLAKHPVLLAKIVNDLQLALIHPPGNGDQQKPEWVENSLGLQSPLSRALSYGWNPPQLHADQVSGPYEMGLMIASDFWPKRMPSAES
jgi:hypothetical protein